MTNVRLIKQEESSWVNAQYQTIDFAPSDFENEVIVVSEIERQKAGVGRLVKISEDEAELGGMFVLSPFRGQGVARSIIEFLLANNQKFSTIYCLPFKKVSHLYRSYGFKDRVLSDTVPFKIRAKYLWCQRHYAEPVMLLSLDRPRKMTLPLR